jgi:hypothetical protein
MPIASETHTSITSLRVISRLSATVLQVRLAPGATRRSILAVSLGRGSVLRGSFAEQGFSRGILGDGYRAFLHLRREGPSAC